MTTPTKAVVATAGAHVVTRPGEWTEREAGLIQSALAPGLSVGHMRVFALICRHTGMDPAKRQIYAWIDKGRLCIHIGINGWRQMAVATGEYAGQAGPQWCGPDGQWRDVWLDETPPAAARVGVLRRGFGEPVWHVATWREFSRPNLPTWKEKPAHMLAIRAEGHALQRAFPDVYEAAASVISANQVTVSVGDEGEIVDMNTGEIVSGTEEPAVPLPAGEGEGAPGAVAMGDSTPVAAPSPPPTPKAAWTAFWAEAKRLGFSQADVHGIAGTDSLGHLDADAIGDLLELLRVTAQERSEQRLPLEG